MTSVNLKVGGMTCMGCVAAVTRALNGVQGVAKVEVSLEKAQASIDFDPARVGREQLVAAVEGAGFDVAP